MNDKFSTLPTADDYAQFVTWPLLEDALKGVRNDLEQLQVPVQERVVIETSSQTENRMVSNQNVLQVLCLLIEWILGAKEGIHSVIFLVHAN